MNKLTTEQSESWRLTKHKEVLFFPQMSFLQLKFCALVHKCTEVHLDAIK